MPGELVVVNLTNQGLEVSRRTLWRIDLPTTPAIGHKLPLEDLTEGLLDEAVERQVADQASPCLYLSGGIDSALMASMIASRRPGARAVTLSLSAYPAIDETARARSVANEFGLRHSCVELKQDELLNIVTLFASQIDQPTVDGINTYMLTRGIAESEKVIYSATGPDELFFGYVWMVDILQHFAGREDSISRDELAKSWISHCFVFTPKDIARLLGLQEIDIGEALQDAVTEVDPGPGFSLQTRIKLICLRRFTLDRLLRDFDVCTMAFGIEGRVPFLSETIVRWALAMNDPRLFVASTTSPPSIGYVGQGYKPSIVEVARRRLPPAYFEGPGKWGFVLPLDAWLRDPVAQLVSEIQMDCPVGGTRTFDVGNVKALTTQLRTDAGACHRLWLLLIMDLWLMAI